MEFTINHLPHMSTLCFLSISVSSHSTQPEKNPPATTIQVFFFPFLPHNKGLLANASLPSL